MSASAAALCADWSSNEPAAVSAASVAAAFTAAQQHLWHEGERLQTLPAQSGGRHLQDVNYTAINYPSTPLTVSSTTPVGSTTAQVIPPGCRRRALRDLAVECTAAGEHGQAVAELSFLTAQQLCSERSNSQLSDTAPADTALFSAQLRCLNEIVAVVETFWQCLDPTVRAAACSEVLAHKDAWVQPSEDTLSLCESSMHRYLLARAQIRVRVLEVVRSDRHDMLAAVDA
eukprot:14486-Heterococcus_DN1.PRE.2